MDLCTSRTSGRSFAFDLARSVRRRADSATRRLIILLSTLAFFLVSLLLLYSYSSTLELCAPAGASSPNFELLTEVLTSFTSTLDQQESRLHWHMDLHSSNLLGAGNELNNINVGHTQTIGQNMIEVSKNAVKGSKVLRLWNARSISIKKAIGKRTDDMLLRLTILDQRQPNLLENVLLSAASIHCPESSRENYMARKHRAAIEEIYLEASKGIDALPDILTLGATIAEEMIDFRRKSYTLQADIIQEIYSLSEARKKILSSWLAKFRLHNVKKVQNIDFALLALQKASYRLDQFNQPLHKAFISGQFNIFSSPLRFKSMLKQLHHANELSIKEHIHKIRVVVKESQKHQL